MLMTSKDYWKYWHALERVTTASEVAKLWEVNERTVKVWIDTGRIVAIQPGGEFAPWIVSLDSVIAFRGYPPNLPTLPTDDARNWVDTA
jgi:hypothetical protein